MLTKPEFSQQILGREEEEEEERKNLKRRISSKSVQWEPSVLYGRANMTKLRVAFRNFANAPKT
jgi:hypothetical protein